MTDQFTAGWLAGRDAAAHVVEERAFELDQQECCGSPTYPSECCGDPVFMISSADAAHAIRALTPPVAP